MICNVILAKCFFGIFFAAKYVMQITTCYNDNHNVSGEKIKFGNIKNMDKTLKIADLTFLIPLLHFHYQDIRKETDTPVNLETPCTMPKKN